MSWQATGWAYAQTGLDPTDKLLLICLADTAGGGYISYLATFAGCSAGRVAEGLARLSRADLIRSVMVDVDGRVQADLTSPDETTGESRSRRPVSPDLRQAVMHRDEHRCQHCLASSELQLDHIIPWSAGGPTTYDNLQVLCRWCNRAKSNKVAH